MVVLIGLIIGDEGDFSIGKEFFVGELGKY
jgi:hypothetical protein